MSKQIPSNDELTSIAAALQEFIVLYDRYKLFLCDVSDPMIALVPTSAVRESLCRLERLLNPRRLPYGSQELKGTVIAHWPYEVMTGLPILRKHVYQLIERWDIPEICDDRLFVYGNFSITNTRKDGKIEETHINRPPQPHTLTADEWERLIWVLNVLLGVLRLNSEKVGEETKPPTPQKPMKEPSANAFAAYRAVRVAGLKQEDVGRRLGVEQSTISRWIDKVVEWLEAGNVLPDELAAEPPRPKIIPVDPRKLGQGPRRRGRA